MKNDWSDKVGMIYLVVYIFSYYIFFLTLSLNFSKDKWELMPQTKIYLQGYQKKF